MKKNFTFILPDEPYKDTTELNQVINATYDGHRYLLARVNDSTHVVEGIFMSSDNLADLEISKFPDEEGYTFLLIDASVNPFEAAYISGNYKHDIIEDPTYELPNGLGSWTYHYDDYTGGINQAFYQFTLKYVNGNFVKPKYRLHALTRESVMSNAKLQAKTIRQSLSENDFDADDRTKLEEYADWLDALETTYAGIDHWKITFPTEVPKY